MSVDRILTPIAWLPMVLALLGGPLVLWWLVEPGPLEVQYIAPTFLSEPAMRREDVGKTSVVAVSGGSVVYRYVEYCVRRPFTATARRSWVSSALVWHAPDVPSQLSRTPGCSAINIAVEVPTSNPTRSFSFVQTMDVDVNPIRTDRLEYPPIPLTILAPSK